MAPPPNGEVADTLRSHRRNNPVNHAGRAEKGRFGRITGASATAFRPEVGALCMVARQSTIRFAESALTIRLRQFGLWPLGAVDI